MSMDEKAKLHLLSRLAHELNAHGVTWALGASCFLYLKGIAPSFHDLDIMVDEKDVKTVEALFLARGEKQPDHYDRSRYGTKVFDEYVIEGVDLDVMAGFSILKDGKEYRFPLKKEAIVDHLRVEGEDIPVESLEAWRERYALMSRPEKVAMIDRALGRSV
jgi:hypothetical protein